MSERQATLALGFHSISLEDVKSKHGDPPWHECVVSTDQMLGTVICQPPGQVNDKHYHNKDEWWVVMEGEIHWDIEGSPEPVKAKAGDFVLVPKRHFHHIHVKGDKPAIRLAIGAAGEKHLHDR